MDEFSARIPHTHQSVAFYIPREALDEETERRHLDEYEQRT